MEKQSNTDNKLAEERTQLAARRNVLAAERTFSAWIRTGIAAVAAGLGIAKLIFSGTLIALIIGGCFVAAGTAVYIFALASYIKEHQTFHGKKVKLPLVWLFSALVVFLSLLSGAAYVLLLVRD